MRQATLAVTLAALLAATAVSAAAQDGDAAAGRAFAREACKLCHIVEPDERATRSIVIGPGFRDIANTPGMTATALRVFLTTSHPKMPNLILTSATDRGCDRLHPQSARWSLSAKRCFSHLLFDKLRY
jgi:cytochrome c551/c552